jgi:hypothetical protein
MPYEKDSSRVKIQLSIRDKGVSSRSGKILVIEYKATPVTPAVPAAPAAPTTSDDDKESKKFRNHHYGRIDVTYNHHIRRVEKEEDIGSVRMTIKFNFDIFEGSDRFRVRTSKKEDIDFMKKFFFDLRFTINEESSDSQPFEIRLEDREYSYEVWKKSMPDGARSKGSTQKTGKKQDKEMKTKSKRLRSFF